MGKAQLQVWQGVLSIPSSKSRRAGVACAHHTASEGGIGCLTSSCMPCGRNSGRNGRQGRAEQKHPAWAMQEGKVGQLCDARCTARHTNKGVAVGTHGGVSATGVVLHGHLQSQQHLHRWLYGLRRQGTGCDPVLCVVQTSALKRVWASTSRFLRAHRDTPEGAL